MCSALIDFDFEHRVLVVLASLLHVPVQEASHIAVTVQECLLGCTGGLVCLGCLLGECLSHWSLACLSRKVASLGFELFVCLLQLSVYRVLLLVSGEHPLELAFLLLVFLGLCLAFVRKPFQCLLELLHFFLLKVQSFQFDLVSLVFRDILRRHLLNLLLQLVQLRLLQGYSLAGVSCLFGECDILRLTRLLLLTWRLHLLHLLLLSRAWQWGLPDELIMDGLDQLTKRGVLGPLLDHLSLVLDRALLNTWMDHVGHHMNLRAHLRELIS